MSGGVDSSVAAALLVEQGHDVTGVTLKLWGGESDSGCCSVADVEDARRVAAQLGIPHYVFNFTDEFDAAVVDPYVAAYAAGAHAQPVRRVQPRRSSSVVSSSVPMRSGSTPWPPATTRASRPRPTARCALRRGADPAKDQSYVLYMLGQRELARTLLPVGELTKAEVREHAARLGLRTAAKAESMDVCFITRGGREQFLESRARRAPERSSTPPAPWSVAHDGVAAFTVGQRRGVGVAVGERRYVVDVDARDRDRHHRRLAATSLRDTVQLRDLTFVDASVPCGARVQAQTRAHGEPGRRDVRRRRRSCSRRRSRGSRPARWSRSTTASTAWAVASRADGASTGPG